MDKTELRQKAFKFLSYFGKNIKTKFSNICGKTGEYSVPHELFQKRTPRKNRALISWKAVKENNLTLDMLNNFEGGVVVEFKNNDFFDESNKTDSLFKELSKRLGCNQKVSSIISIRSEDGNPSSEPPRCAFDKLINNTKVLYNEKEITITRQNYKEYAIKQDIKRMGKGNNTWSGFLYVSIRGGQQDTTETHSGQELTLFNPACEYASTDVCEDINLVMAYFALVSIKEDDFKDLNDEIQLIINKGYCNQLINEIEELLKTISYQYHGFNDNLYNYVKKHYSVSLYSNQLTDPIQLTDISIKDFDKSERTEDSIDFTHEEPVLDEKYYWDKIHGILSPARPTNIFWSFHLSNMMQQNYKLDEYFQFEEERFNKRKQLIKKNK